MIMKTETVDVPNSKRRHFRPTEIRPVRCDPGLQVCSGLHEGEQASFCATNELGCSDRTISLTCDTSWFILYLVSLDGLVLPHGTHLSFCVPMTIQESRVENCGTKKLCLPWAYYPCLHISLPSGNHWKFLLLEGVPSHCGSKWQEFAFLFFSVFFHL